MSSAGSHLGNLSQSSTKRGVRLAVGAARKRGQSAGATAPHSNVADKDQCLSRIEQRDHNRYDRRQA